MIRIYFILFLAFIGTSFSGNPDRIKFTNVTIQYGNGNHFAAFSHRNFSDNASYNEFMINFERNIFRQFGINLNFQTVQNKETGFGSCEGPIPYRYSLETSAYLGSASFYLNWKYIGFKFGLMTFKREAGFCEESADKNALYPMFDLKAGLINSLYFIINTPEDLIFSSLNVGVKYHFKNYHSSIFIGKTIQDSDNNFYLVKINFQVYKSFLLTSQGYIDFSKKINGLRIGVGYIFERAG